MGADTSEGDHGFEAAWIETQRLLAADGIVLIDPDPQETP